MGGGRDAWLSVTLSLAAGIPQRRRGSRRAGSLGPWPGPQSTALQPRGGSLCSSVPGRLPPGPVQGHLGPGAGGDRARGGTSTRTADGEAGDRVPRRPSLAPAARVTREELAASCRRVRGSPSQWGVSPTSVSGVRFGASAGQGPWGDADGVASWGGRARTSEPSSEVRLALHARAAQRGAWPPAARPPPLPPQPPRPEGRLPVVVLDAPGCRASPGGFQPGCLPRAFTLSLLCTPPPPPPTRLVMQSPLGLAHTVTACSGYCQMAQPGHLPPLFP